jgi:hypothetical protein
MFEKLETYLEEISHFLSLRQGREEILAEIKSHILEKAEREYGEINGSTLSRVIAAYGSPRKVAEKYLEDIQIIAPSFKRYLIRYTGILFLFHFGLTVAAFLADKTMLVLPFFYIPRLEDPGAFLYFPMALIFDLGLVGLILYLITQSRKNIRLPWPKLKMNWEMIEKKRAVKTKIIPFLLLLALLLALVYAYVRYGTTFFLNPNFKNPQSLFGPEASRFYSLALISALAVDVVSSFIRFFVTSEWVRLAKNGILLILVGIIINTPIKDALMEFPNIQVNLKPVGTFIIILAVLISLDFLKGLVIIGRKLL